MSAIYRARVLMQFLSVLLVFLFLIGDLFFCVRVDILGGGGGWVVCVCVCGGGVLMFVCMLVVIRGDHCTH